MKRVSAIALSLGLGACQSLNPLAQAPTITLNANGTASASAPTQAPTGAGPITQIATDLGNAFSKDDVAGVNLACGTPVADPIGCNFFTDLANLANSLKVPGAATSAAGTLSQIEQLRLGLMSVNALAQNQLLAKTLADGLIWVQDTKAKGLAVPAAVTGLLGDIAVLLAVPGL